MELAHSNAKRDKTSWQASFKQVGENVQLAVHPADISPATVQPDSAAVAVQCGRRRRPDAEPDRAAGSARPSLHVPAARRHAAAGGYRASGHAASGETGATPCARGHRRGRARHDRRAAATGTAGNAAVTTLKNLIIGQSGDWIIER